MYARGLAWQKHYSDRTTPKPKQALAFGRNEIVTARDPVSGETKTTKYKYVEALVQAAAWEIVGGDRTN